MGTPLVIDTSVAIKWLSQDNEHLLGQADAILQDIYQKKITACLPAIADYEIGNVLLKGKHFAPHLAAPALNLYYRLPLQRLPLTKHLAIITYRIAHRYEITFYDAAFVAAAHSLKATLVTDNLKHQGLAKDIRVIPLAHYAKL